MARTPAVLLALALLAPVAALAGWTIELREGGSVLASSYKVEGDKIVAYRPAGALVLERAHVKAIRETDREPAAAGPVVTGVGAPAAPPPAPRAAPPEPAAPAAAVADPKKAYHDLSVRILMARGDLQFARNRGEDAAALDRRRKEIDRLERDRRELGKTLP